ncbi:hypothetical protein [Nocardia higoensis]|uniref:hypothetical protein n=1 Tax=Nocardia higoensis TaxID=228599 RepID=UPI00031CBC2F|nr:hypothetical protein [Nocardia higoensis]
MNGPIPAAGESTQLAIARVRARVLGGRGLGASAEERARAQRRRDLLGALPAPLERELVSCTGELIRTTPTGPVLDELRQRFEELCSAWLPAGGPPPALRLTPAWSRDDDSRE